MRIPWLAVAALALVAVLAGFGLMLRAAQRDGVRSAERRFAERAQVSAALTQSVFGALGSSSGAELKHQLGGSRGEVLAWLHKQFGPSHVAYMAVLDHRANVVAAVGAVPSHFATGEALRGGPALSDVRSSPAGRVIEFAPRFEGRDGQPRLLVEGLPVALMRAFLNDYLARLPNPDGASLKMVDGAGVPLANGKSRLATHSGAQRVTTSALVPGTRWRLRLVADRNRVLAGLTRMPWLSWSMLGALAIALLMGLALFRRVAHGSRRERVANRTIRESQEKLHALVDALEEAVFLRHADGRLELLNEAAKRMLETDADVLVDAVPGWSSLTDEGSPLAAEDTPVMVALDTGIPQRRVVGLQRPDASRSWFEVSARPLMHAGMEAPYAVVVSCTDVTERRELELHLTDLAARDPLTGLWNRRRFEQDVAHQLARCGRYDERATLLVLDIDGFKQVNDTLGHLTGDDVLRAIADALRARLRASDSAARLGGDEFAVLLLNAGEEEVAAVAADLKDRLMKAARTVQDRIALSLSIGVAPLDGLTEGVAEAIAAADRAMYANKEREGRSSAATIVPAAPAKLGVARDLEADGLAPTLAALRSLTRADVAWLARATVAGSRVESAFDGQDTVGVVAGVTFPAGGRPPQAGDFLSVAMSDGRSTLCVARRDPGNPFGTSDDELVASFAPVVAEQLRRDGAIRAGTELASLRALLAAVNARDSYTGGHSRQVVTLARAVASRMGLEDAAINEVEHVALLHDLGKIAIPDSILRKPGPLVEHEQVLMRQHPVVGGEIVASTPELAHLAPAIRAEHERWDGGGYPDGLAGESIPIASRITFVCDAYHAMTSHRPYRRALSGEEARAEIARAAGSQFCPVAAEALLDVLSLRGEVAIAAA